MEAADGSDFVWIVRDFVVYPGCRHRGCSQVGYRSVVFQELIETIL